LHIDLDSNPKPQLPHMRIVANNYNNRTNAYSNGTMWMRIPKSDTHIIYADITNIYIYIRIRIFIPRR
jgi:hypothetical protein